jgi:branched-chain amino acid aminotransferase
MRIDELTFEQVVTGMRAIKYPAQDSYRAMYSSWLGGIVRDPQLMTIPIDDHGFHRGDAVFEAIKCVNRKIYALDQHLERMQRSASYIGLKLPLSISDMREIAIETTLSAKVSDAILRFYVSRGPGGFTANPYDSVAPQTYLVVTSYTAPAHSKYENGVSAKVSSISIKEGFFSTVKSCNYLPNVMMKKEAVDQGVDFTVSVDEEGFLGEGSTENFAILSERGEFLVPGFERTLKGITISRMMELAKDVKGVTAIRNAQITVADVEKAKEAFMFGTTLDCLPVTQFNGKPVGDGKVGQVAKAFLLSLSDDLIAGPLLTKLYERSTRRG